MRPLQIVEDTNGISVVRIEDKRCIASFTSGQLIHTREDSISDCIAHLDEKEGSIPKDFLYQLALFIQQKYPKHQINWRNTFWLIEAHKHRKINSNLGLADVVNRVYENIISALSPHEVQKIKNSVDDNLLRNNLA